MKRIVSLLLILTLTFSMLSACKKEKPTETDQTHTAEETLSSPESTEKGGSETETAGGMASMLRPMMLFLTVEDPAALLTVMGAAVPANFDMKHLSLGAAMDFDKMQMLYALEGSVLNQNVDSKLFFTLDKLILSSELLDENYSLSPQQASGSSLPPATEAFLSDPAKVEALFTDYLSTLTSSIEKNLSATKQENANGQIHVSLTLTPRGLATVLVDLVEKFCADDALLDAVLPLFDPSLTKEAFLQGKPSREALIQDVESSMAALSLNGTVSITYDKNQGALNRLDANLQYRDPSLHTLSLEIAQSESQFDFTFRQSSDVAENDLLLRFKITESGALLGIAEGNAASAYHQLTLLELVKKPNEATLSYVRSGAENASLEFVLSYTAKSVSLDVSSTADNKKIRLFSAKGSYQSSVLRLDLTLYGENQAAETISVLFNVSLENGVTLTLDKIIGGPNQSMTLDLSSAGLKIGVITDFAFPALPEAKPLDNATEAELNAILQKFQTDNAALIQYLSTLFGSSESVPEQNGSVSQVNPAL